MLDIYLDENCSVCLEHLKDEIIATPCGHIFHKKCCVFNTCPICRKEIQHNEPSCLSATEMYQKSQCYCKSPISVCELINSKCESLVGLCENNHKVFRCCGKWHYLPKERRPRGKESVVCPECSRCFHCKSKIPGKCWECAVIE